MALFEAEFAPCPSLGDLWVYVFLDDGCADSACHFDLFAVIVETVRYDRLGAILVGCDLLCGERGGVVKLLVVGPVGAAVNRKILAFFLIDIFKSRTHFSSFDMVAVVCEACESCIKFLDIGAERCGFHFLSLRLGGAPLWLELASSHVIDANISNNFRQQHPWVFDTTASFEGT